MWLLFRSFGKPVAMMQARFVTSVLHEHKQKQCCEDKSINAALIRRDPVVYCDKSSELFSETGKCGVMKEGSLCAVGKPWLHTPCCTCTHLTLKGLRKHVCVGVINIVLIKWNWIHLCSFDYTFTVHIHTRLQRCYQLRLTALQLCLEQHTSYFCSMEYVQYIQARYV